MNAPLSPSAELAANVSVPFAEARAMPKSVYTSPEFLAQRGVEAMVSPELSDLRAQLSRQADGLAGALYRASPIGQGCNIVRRELGLPSTYTPAADPRLQIDVVPGRSNSNLR